MNTAPDIRTLVPQAGSMCLLARAVSWDERGATFQATSHAAADHPLRRAGTLHAVTLCEYGAQAMAAHGSLVAGGGGVRPGMLVSLRDVVLAVAAVDATGGELTVEVERLAAGAAGLQYRFCVTQDGAELASGRAAVIGEKPAS